VKIGEPALERKIRVGRFQNSFGFGGDVEQHLAGEFGGEPLTNAAGIEAAPAIGRFDDNVLQSE